MLRRTWIAIPALAVGVLLALPAGAQDTRDTQAELADLLLADGMTQEEVAVELLRALDGTELAQPDCVPGEEMFDDVPASSPFCPFIEELARRGITTGCDDDNFCPGATVSRAQMATFIVRAMEAAATQTSPFMASDETVVVGNVPTTLFVVPVAVPSSGGAVTATATLQMFVPAGTSVSCFIVIAGSQGLPWEVTPPAGESLATTMTFVHRSNALDPTSAILQCTKEGENPTVDPFVSQRTLNVIATPLPAGAEQ